MNSNKLQYPCMINQEKLPMRKIIRQFIFFEKNTTQATPQKANEHLCSTMGKWMALRMAHFMHAFAPTNMNCMPHDSGQDSFHFYEHTVLVEEGMQLQVMDMRRRTASGDPQSHNVAIFRRVDEGNCFDVFISDGCKC